MLGQGHLQHRSGARHRLEHGELGLLGDLLGYLPSQAFGQRLQSPSVHKLTQFLLAGFQRLIGERLHLWGRRRQCIGIQAVGLGRLAQPLGQFPGWASKAS